MANKGMQIKITGMEALIRKLQASHRASVIMEGLFVGGLHMAAWSKKNRLTGPRPQFLGVVSGRLRSSITVAPTAKRGEGFITTVGTNVVYGRMHELGESNESRKVRARPFLRPALEDRQNQREVVNILQRRLQSAIERQT